MPSTYTTKDGTVRKYYYYKHVTNPKPRGRPKKNNVVEPQPVIAQKVIKSQNHHTAKAFETEADKIYNMVLNSNNLDDLKNIVRGFISKKNEKSNLTNEYIKNVLTETVDLNEIVDLNDSY